MRDQILLDFFLLDQGRRLSREMIMNLFEKKKINVNNMRRMKETLLLKLVFKKNLKH